MNDSIQEFNQATIYVIQGWNSHKKVQYRAVIKKRKNEFGEYVARFYEDGVYMGNGSDYFGSDFADAKGTARACILFMCADTGEKPNGQ